MPSTRVVNIKTKQSEDPVGEKLARHVGWLMKEYDYDILALLRGMGIYIVSNVLNEIPPDGRDKLIRLAELNAETLEVCGKDGTERFFMLGIQLQVFGEEREPESTEAQSGEREGDNHPSTP